jgi:small-conductance mechanosensitive channel
VLAAPPALASLREALGLELFRLGATPITAFTVVALVVVLLITAWVARGARRTVTRLLDRRGSVAVATVGSLVHYGIVATGIAVALSTAGIDLTALFAAGAIFAVAFGFAMQNMAQTFVAGVILLTERIIKPGDVLELDGKLVKVLELRVRCSVLQTRDGETLVIPNTTLVQNKITTFSRPASDGMVRLRTRVGVAYGSDMDAVRETLTLVARDLGTRWGVRGRESEVLLADFGDNAVLWDVAVWTSDPWTSPASASELREAVWWALKARGIVIAFPQVDVHLDGAALAALRGAPQGRGP